MEVIIVDRIKKEIFRYLLDLKGTSSLKVDIVFENDIFKEVQFDDDNFSSDDPSVKWEIYGTVSQLVDNAKRKISEKGFFEPEPDGIEQDRGKKDYDFNAENVKDIEDTIKEEESSHHYFKLDVDKVVKLRKYWRNPQHRDLVLEAEAERMNMSGTGLYHALIGKTWKSANELEPPLSIAEYHRALYYKS